MEIDTAMQMGLGLFPQLQSNPGVSVPWWIWALVILAGVLVVGFSIFIRMGSDNPQPPAAPPTPPPPAPQATAAQTENQPQVKVAPQTAEIDSGHMEVKLETGPAGATPREIDLPQPEMEIEAAGPEPEISPALFALGPDRDDLKLVHGITPGILSVLNAAGIRTFAQLAGTSVDQLEKTLRSAGIRTKNSASWPEQASLAAQGDWEGLNALQQKLRSTR